MRIINKWVSCFLPLLCFLFTTQAIAETSSWKDAESASIFNEYSVVGEKIYIQPDQLHITDRGIFIFIQGEQFFVQQINCDENGIYCWAEHLDKITDKCYNGHYIWCKRCFGCAVRYCKFRCKCAEWE